MSLLAFTAGNFILLSVLVFNAAESPFSLDFNHRTCKITRLQLFCFTLSLKCKLALSAIFSVTECY